MSVTDDEISGYDREPQDGAPIPASSPVLPESTLREQVARAILGVASTVPLDTVFVRHREALATADALLPLFAVVSAEAEKRGKRQAWDEACMAFGWALDNGPVEGAAAYVARTNPYIPEPEKGQNT